MGKTYLNLQNSEMAVLQAASTIYAGYIQSGAATDENANEYMERSIKEAVRLAATVEKVIIAEGEMDDQSF